MNKAKLTNDDAYSQLLNELAQLQIQITTAKPTNLKALLDRQLTIHEAITQRLTQLATAAQIMPSDDLQSIIRPPYVVTFLLQNDAARKGDFLITVHCLSFC